MKKSKPLLWLSLILVLVLAACGGQQTAEPVEQEAPTTAPVPTEAPPTAAPPTEVVPTEVPPTAEPEESGSYLDSIEHTPDEALINVSWEWVQRALPDGEVTIEVTDPTQYRLLFNADGTFNAELDCNVAAGGYATRAGGSIFMELGPMTMAACGPESLADQMMQMFGPAQAYRFEDDGQTLIFSWAAGGPVDTFRAAGSGEAMDDSMDSEASAELIGKTWQWLGTTTPVEQIDVVDPTRYTITFNDDSTAFIKADCNNVIAEYTFDGSALTIMPGPSTLAACPEDSQDQLFVQQLSAAALAFFQEGDLFIDQFADGGTMRFTAEEIVDLPEPEAGDAVGSVIASDGVFLRSGPGTSYFPLGTAAQGDTGTIIGISEDGEWWVVEAPNLPGGQVWVAAAFIEATGADNVPVVPAPAGPGLVGATWQWAGLTTPLEQTEIADPSRYTIQFNLDGTASIMADCNLVGATYSADAAGAITISLGPSTLALCPEDSQDQLFLQSLGSAAIYFNEDGQLFLDLMADAGTMRFIPSIAGAPGAGDDSPVASAQNIEFQVTSFGPVGGESPLVPGTQITALFTSTDVSGFAGCNTYTGTLTPVEDFFTVGPIAATLMACSEPAGIMEQESSYLAALGALSGFEWVQGAAGAQNRVTAGQLFYTTPDGAAGVINLISTQ